MATTFLDIANRILAEVEEDTVNAASFSAPASGDMVYLVKGYVNDAYREVMSYGRTDYVAPKKMSPLSTLTANTRILPIDSSVNPTRVTWLWIDGTEFKPAFMELKQALVNYPDLLTKTGKPEMVYIDDGQLCVYPTPNVDTNFYYEGFWTFTELVNATDEPVLPEDYRDILYLGGLAQALMHDRQDGQASAVSQKYYKRITDLKAFEAFNSPIYSIKDDSELQTYQLEQAY